MEGAGLMIAFFAGVWGSFGMMLRIIEMLNERRDIVLGMKSTHCNLIPSNRKHLLYADWVPLWVVSVIFLTVVVIFFAALPNVGNAKIDSVAGFQTVAYLSSLLAAAGLAAQTYGGLIDYRRMRNSLQRVTDPIVGDPRVREKRRQERGNHGSSAH